MHETGRGDMGAAGWLYLLYAGYFSIALVTLLALAGIPGPRFYWAVRRWWWRVLDFFGAI